MILLVAGVGFIDLHWWFYWFLLMRASFVCVGFNGFDLKVVCVWGNVQVFVQCSFAVWLCLVHAP